MERWPRCWVRINLQKVIGQETRLRGRKELTWKGLFVLFRGLQLAVNILWSTNAKLSHINSSHSLIQVLVRPAIYLSQREEQNNTGKQKHGKKIHCSECKIAYSGQQMLVYFQLFHSRASPTLSTAQRSGSSKYFKHTNRSLSLSSFILDFSLSAVL